MTILCLDCRYDKQFRKCQIVDAYEKIVHWRNNLFDIPKGKAGKSFVAEMTQWINKWCEKSDFGEVAFKVISIMPNLLLQKT